MSANEKLKILFIVKTVDFIEPFGMMSISAVAKSFGHETYLGVMTRENILKKIAKIGPDIVAYSSCTGEHKYYMEINKQIKKKYNVFTIMGGSHPTFYPECIKDGDLDAICIGEGECAFGEFLKKFEPGNNTLAIDNIISKNAKGGLRDLCTNLDDLPFPDRGLFYEHTELGKFPMKNFMASRGCPYSCTYCFNHAYRKLYQNKGKMIRRRSVANIMSEISMVLEKYPVEFIKFYDDIFTYDVDEWLIEFSKEYRKNIKIPFHCFMRANLVNEEIIKLLKETGCHSISMSIEAGNAKLRNEVLKRNMLDKEIINAFGLLYKYDIKSFSNSILALPFSKVEDDIESVDFTIKCHVTFSEFPILNPYPRTEIGDLCIKNGLFDDKNYNKLHMSVMNKSPLLCFTEKEKNIQKNISQLGVVVVWLPFLRNIAMKYLIYLRPNKIFFLLYFLAKTYLVKTKIYPIKVNLRTFFSNLIKGLKLEAFKHSDE